jgi:hypothetical protein
MAGATGAVRSIGFLQTSSVNELLSISDAGVLVKKSSASYAAISGASWASGYEQTMTQLNNRLYILSDNREMSRYDGTTLVSFATLATPTISGISNLSGASGIGELTTVSYRVSVEGKVGETLASTPISLASVSADPTKNLIRFNWGAVSAASGDLLGYIVYGREQGQETFMYRTTKETITYDDDGTNTPSQLAQPPLADTTGGLKAKFVTRYQDRLVFSGIPGDPCKVVISARVPWEDRTSLYYGGGYVLVDPDSGDNVTGLGVLRDKIIVFKERSIWELTISLQEVGGYMLLNPTYNLLTSSHGCVSHKTIKAVEDDLFFLSRKGVYSIGFKPNILNVLSTTEISAKIRDKLSSINESKWSLASAEYADFRYILSYPDGSSNYPNRMMTFDRERIAWMGPWYIEGNNLINYYDSDGKQHLLYGSVASPFVRKVASDYTTDSGNAIDTTLRTKKEDFGSWNLFKTIKDIFFQFKDVKGSVLVDVFIEERSGSVITAKNFSISSSSGESGWGSLGWGNFVWGDSEAHVGDGDISEIIKWLNTNITGRSLQIQVKTTDATADYKLLGIKMEAQIQGKGSIPASYRV